MPGIIGFLDFGLERENQVDILSKMRDMITHREFYVKDELFSDNIVYATRSHIDVIQKAPQPLFSEGVYMWMDGELRDLSEKYPKEAWNYNNDLELLAKLYKKSNDFSFLKNLDGVFSIVIYDSIKQQVHLISDWIGLRHLYWTIYKGQLVWSSEVKTVLALPNFKPVINTQSVKEFFDAGYLLENSTWFDGVSLLDPASVLTWDIKSRNFNIARYWWWDQIKPLEYKISEDEIIEEMSRLFKASVKKSCSGNVKVGLTLSGGLDSRAILASMPITSDEIHAFTFGQKNCIDIRYASKAAKVKGAIHHTVDISSDNWLNKRLEGVWWTDGHLNLMHMHGIESIDLMRSLYGINLDGLGAGAYLGGSRMLDKSFLESPVDMQKASLLLHCNSELITFLGQYSNLSKTDYILIQNRVRRFVYEGLMHSNTAIENRMPFHDKELVQFMYSLPDSIRFGRYIYKKMLLKIFPEYYKRIPWQRTGLTIDKSDLVFKAYKKLKGVRNRSLRILNRFGFPYDSYPSMCNYPQWIKRSPANELFSNVLLNETALYKNYISEDLVKRDWEEQKHGINHAEKLCLYLTFEIWLQQVYNNKFLKQEY